jgi:hypothetical protein
VCKSVYTGATAGNFFTNDCAVVHLVAYCRRVCMNVCVGTFFKEGVFVPEDNVVALVAYIWVCVSLCCVTVCVSGVCVCVCVCVCTGAITADFFLKDFVMTFVARSSAEGCNVLHIDFFATGSFRYMCVLAWVAYYVCMFANACV